MTEPKTQSDKFKAAAKEHGADPSVKRWDERLRKVAKSKVAAETHPPAKPQDR